VGRADLLVGNGLKVPPDLRGTSPKESLRIRFAGPRRPAAPSIVSAWLYVRTGLSDRPAHLNSTRRVSFSPRFVGLAGGARSRLGVPVYLLARAKCSRVLENRGWVSAPVDRPPKPFNSPGLVPRQLGCHWLSSGRCDRRWRTNAILGERSWTTANGFEDPRGRVEFRTGPKGPLTQRSINRLGARRIVFQRTLPF
jgi:hypothetical protein